MFGVWDMQLSMGETNYIFSSGIPLFLIYEEIYVNIV